MAYENIDWSLPLRAQEARSARFQEMLGSAVGKYLQKQQFDEQMDLRRREMDMKKEALPPMNQLDYQMIQRFQAGDKSPEVIAHLKTRAAMEGAKTQYTRDPFNPATLVPQTSPNQFDVLLGGQPREPAQQPAMQPMVQSFGGQPVSTGARSALPQVPQKQGADSMDVIGGLPDTPRYTGSQLEQMEAGKARTALQAYAAEKSIDLNNLSKEKKLELAFEMEKAERMSKKEQEEQKEQKKPQELLAIESAFQEAENMNSTISDIYNNADWLTTGFIGQKTSGVGGTPAHDLAANLDTIKSDAGLSKLIEVKERGGTFGALQEKELDLLIANRAALLQSQSSEQFKENLIKYQQQRNETMKLMANFFDDKYGYVPKGLLEGLDKNIIDPRLEKAKAGAVFENSKGERFKLVGKEWQKIQ